MIDKEKYITFKREQIPADMLDDLEPIEIKDARVIRDQDAFASSAFYAYAHHIRGVIDVMKTVGFEDYQMEERLNDLADYFMSAAECAEQAANRKLPD